MTIFTVLAAHLCVSEFDLRNNVSKHVTAFDLPEYFHSPDLEKVQRMLLFDDYQGTFQDLRIISLLFHCSFVQLNHEGDIHAAVFSGSGDPLFELGPKFGVEFGSSVTLLERSRAKMYTDDHTRLAFPRWRASSLFVKDRTKDLNSLLSWLVFSNDIVMYNYPDPMLLLYSYVERSRLRIGFVVYDGEGNIEAEVGANVDLCYFLVHDGLYWSMKGSIAQQEDIFCYSSFYQNDAFSKKNPLVPTVTFQLLRLAATLDELKECVIRLNPTTVVILNRMHGTLEVLTDDADDLPLDLPRSLRDVAFCLPGFIVISIHHDVPPTLQQQRLNVSSSSVFTLLNPTSQLVVGPGRGFAVRSDQEHFLDWRMVYTSEILGYIPDCRNEWTSIEQVDPMDITGRNISFVQRWRPGFHRSHKTIVNADFVISDTQDTITFQQLRKREKHEPWRRLPFCPLFLEPNAFLDRLDRFRVGISPFLESLQVLPPHNNGLIAKRTLLKGVQYPQLKYCGPSLTADAVEQSSSKFIWKFASGICIDGSGCTLSLSRFINSADYKDEKDQGAYRVQRKRVNIRMVEHLMQYVPSKNIHKGTELICLYGEEYWMG